MSQENNDDENSRIEKVRSTIEERAEGMGLFLGGFVYLLLVTQGVGVIEISGVSQQALVNLGFFVFVILSGATVISD